MADSSQITERELAILQDRDFLLTKRVIDEKITGLLIRAQQKLLSHIQEQDLQLPRQVSLSPRKIARGENYNALPYWVCDFPASLDKKDIWAFRVVVWWGNEVSLSLILKGKFKKPVAKISFYPEVEEVFYATHTDPWKLELDTESSVRLTEKNVQKVRDHYKEADFLKLSMSLALNDINKLPEQSVISFDKLLATANSLA